jgi:hypothetical protein
MIGNRPAMMAANVIIFGRTLNRASHDRGIEVIVRNGRPSVVTTTCCYASRGPRATGRSRLVKIRLTESAKNAFDGV